MTKYRVEVEERTTLVRETWIEAASEDEAREAAEALLETGEGSWQQVASDADCDITVIEEVEP